MTQTIIRQVLPNVHTLSRPFSRFGLLKIGNRSTILVLDDGQLIIISPISIQDDKTPLEYVKIVLGGRVKLFIAPDLAHWLNISDWCKVFPEAKVIGVQGHDEKTRGQDVVWDTLFTPQTDPAQVLQKYNLAQELDLCYFSGFVGKDLVVLHRRSGTIIEADLLFNLPATEQYGGITPGGLTSLMNVLSRDSVWSRRFLWYIGKRDEAQMRKSAKVVSDWEFVNLIPCHGDVILDDGKAVWNWIFDRFLR